MTKTEEFTQKLKDIYGSNSEQIIKTHETKKPFTFFINTNQFDSNEVLSELESEGFDITKSNIPNAYINISEKKLSESKLFLENKIYIQQLSSMLPVLALDPKSDEKILDLCASPGSKTVLMANLTKNKANITAVEKSRDRFFKLNRMLQNFKAENIKTLNIDGKIMPHKFPEYLNYFDKILVDAPCSNEVNIDFNNSTWHKFWRSSNAKNYSKLQKGLLNAAIKMCKPGGEIIMFYSRNIFSLVVAAIIGYSLLFKNKRHLDLIQIALLLNIAVVDIFSFYFDQFSTAVFTIIDIGLILLIERYQNKK